MNTQKPSEWIGSTHLFIKGSSCIWLVATTGRHEAYRLETFQAAFVQVAGIRRNQTYAQKLDCEPLCWKSGFTYQIIKESAIFKGPC